MTSRGVVRSVDLATATVCHADPALLGGHVDRLVGYVQRRLSVHASVVAATPVVSV